jgi:nucleoside-diphosphate-sugar epimerase
VKILLAGATGALGGPLTRQLVAAGHEVTGLTRRPDRARDLDAAGARGVVCDVLERDAVLRAAAEAEPDVVMDQTTALPQRYDARKMDTFYRDMIALRLRGTPNLFDAAASTGARLFFQSVAFLYAPDGSARLRTEDDPAFLDGAPYPWDMALPVTVALEQRALDVGGVVLRYGMFYGPGTHFADGNQLAEDIRRRRLPVVGRGSGMGSFIHVEDAAAATVRAVEWDGTGILNIVDDEPLPSREWVRVAAEALGAGRPMRVPKVVARLAAGPLPVHMATTLPGVSNARAKRELGWAPRYPSLRQGMGAPSG